MFPCMPSRRHFWRTLQLQWLFLEDVPCFARETCQEEPSKLLGTGDESRHSQRCKISEALSLTARYSQCWELSQALSLKPQAYLIKTYIAYIRQNMQQNLNSWCISKSSGLIVRLAHVAPCSVVAVMIHHEFSTKHFFFWAWNPRSRHSTAHICSERITFRAGLVPVTGPHFFEHNFLKAVGRTQLEGSCKVCVGKTVLKTNWNLHPCKGKVGSSEAPWKITPPVACLKGHSCEKCLSKYVQDFDLKMQTHF